MLTTILTNLKALQNGYANSWKELEKQLKSLQSELASRKAEAGELGSGYEATKRNCVELERLLKSSGWGPAIIKAQAFDSKPINASNKPKEIPPAKPQQPASRPKNRFR